MDQSSMVILFDKGDARPLPLPPRRTHPHTRTRTRHDHRGTAAAVAAAHFFFFPNSFIPPCPPDLKSDSCFCEANRATRANALSSLTPSLG